MATIPPYLALPPYLLTLEAVQVLFTFVLVFALAATYKPLAQFYDWFHGSKLAIAEHRGYGQTASRWFGVIPAPKLSPSKFRLTGVLFISVLMWIETLNVILVAWIYQGKDLKAEVIGPQLHWMWALLVVLYVVALLLGHLYFSQLYCEAHVGAHVKEKTNQHS